MSQRVLALTAAWHSTNVVKTREKVVFFFAVMSVMFTGLMFGMAPEYVLPHFALVLSCICKSSTDTDRAGGYILHIP